MNSDQDDDSFFRGSGHTSSLFTDNEDQEEAGGAEEAGAEEEEEDEYNDEDQHRDEQRDEEDDAHGSSCRSRHPEITASDEEDHHRRRRRHPEQRDEEDEAHQSSHRSTPEPASSDEDDGPLHHRQGEIRHGEWDPDDDVDGNNIRIWGVHTSRDVTLGEFVQECSQLWMHQNVSTRSIARRGKYLHYVLCGEYGKDHYINLTMAGADLPEPKVTLTRDYDSVIAICDRVPDLEMPIEFATTYQPTMSMQGDHHMILSCMRKRDRTDEPGPYAEGGLWWIPSSVIAWPTRNGSGTRIPRCESVIQVPSEAGWNLLGIRKTLNEFCSEDSRMKQRQLVEWKPTGQVIGCTRKAKGRSEEPMPKTERLARRIEMPEKSYDYGPDLPPEDRIYDEQYPEHARTFLNQVLQQYVSDMLQKVGRAKCGWEHSPLTQNERRMVDIRIMKENDLGGVLTHARMHEGTESQWDSLFDNIFRTPNELNTRKQWSARMEDMRRALKRAFDEFLWCVWSDSTWVCVYEKSGGELIKPEQVRKEDLPCSAVRLIRNPWIENWRFDITSGHMPALWNVEEWGDREDEEEIMAIIEREEREKQKEMDMQEREDRILRERREEEESSEDEAEPDIRRQITDEREPITMEGNRGMLLGEPIVSPTQRRN
ncbi:uncharacterized protein BT62DRAFT_924922 [Guyanagaster necrorhizus]|uniref:Uncharacterized protein n=1 Tax=Guyanagaster necrorhizus TaxID=856835 RepID=A0A9P8AKW5_9AGAR|nr:uncharacterized protein BT62DRAFT_924922 [Guyanagaster necrorhizus MCA 3950]KAG7439099.1 hypothetical protein BT62DRAFT_924922 [Guyanagaster necrorhizus MCA 3950]